MGTINVVEYDRLPCVDGNVVPMNPARRVTGKTYTSTTSTAQADAPDTSTKCLRVAVIEAHYVAMDTTATSNGRLLPAGSVEWFEVGRLNYLALA